MADSGPEEDAVNWIGSYFGVPDHQEVERIFDLLVRRKLVEETPHGYAIVVRFCCSGNTISYGPEP